MKTRVACSVIILALTFASLARSGEYPHKPARCHAPAEKSLCTRFKDRMTRHSNCRGSTHHDIGCTGCRAEKIFIFGSCWEFYEEPCLRYVPPPNWRADKCWGCKR